MTVIEAGRRQGHSAKQICTSLSLLLWSPHAPVCLLGLRHLTLANPLPWEASGDSWRQVHLPGAHGPQLSASTPATPLYRLWVVGAGLPPLREGLPETLSLGQRADAGDAGLCSRVSFRMLGHQPGSPRLNHRGYAYGAGGPMSGLQAQLDLSEHLPLAPAVCHRGPGGHWVPRGIERWKGWLQSPTRISPPHPQPRAR
jgi:hypothetical protein